MCAAAKVASSVMQVANLDRSVSYYCDVFSCRVALREREAALLLTPDDFPDLHVCPTGRIAAQHEQHRRPLRHVVR